MLLATERKERIPDDRVEIEQEEARREQPKRARGWRVRISGVEDPDDLVGAEHEDENHRAADDREERERFRDDHAQLRAWTDCHTRVHRIEDARYDDRLEDRRGGEETIGRR